MRRGLTRRPVGPARQPPKLSSHLSTTFLRSQGRPYTTLPDAGGADLGDFEGEAFDENIDSKDRWGYKDGTPHKHSCAIMDPMDAIIAHMLATVLCQLLTFSTR